MSDPHTYWDELTATALIGVARRAALPAPPPGPLGALLAQLPADDPAAALLAVAAATALYRRAGALAPLASDAPPAPCPADARPPCGPQAARLLDTILATQRPLLAEWLAALDVAGRRLPEGAAPALLELARNDLALRPAIVRALGSRGAWLAGLHPAWAFAAADQIAADPATLEARWQQGTRAERLALLGQLRATHPAQARALLEATWRSEKGADRAAFVEALRQGLSMEDEPLLEAALDDRSQEVRANAAELLARLPASRLAARMTARALALLSYRGGLFARLELTLPEDCDQAMQRDGVSLKPSRGMGERAGWLRALIERTPPQAWVVTWGLDPAAILRLRMNKEWRVVLLGAWATAALHYQDRAWAMALLESIATELDEGPLANLLLLLPPAQREPQLIRLLAALRLPLGRGHPLLAALRRADPWGPELARAVIAALARTLNPLRDETCYDWHLRAALDDFALSMPPALAEQALAAFPTALVEHPQWSAALATFAERLHLRREIAALG